MPKICPNCQTEYDDNHGFCSNCGSRLVDKPETLNPMLNLGDANAISGGVNINQSKNITSHDVHYHSTTVQERMKSDSEIKLDAFNQLRAKAHEILAEHGRIDSVAMNQLRPLSVQLGIDDEMFRNIIKEVRSAGNGTSNGLSVANAKYLQQAQQAVQTNNLEELSNLTSRLEAMAAISQDDNVQYMHYLSLSILYPLKSIEVYENQTDENYWRTFWAIASYIRTGNSSQAIGLLAKFNPARYEKSEDDQNLLEAFSSIMSGDKDSAQEFLDEILGETSAQIQPLHRAIETVLYEEQPENLEIRFYQERVMSKSDTVVNKQEKTSTIKQPEVKEPAPVEEEIETQSKKSDTDAEKLYLEACKASGAKKVMLLQQAAELGYLDAMYDLSECFDDGNGVSVDLKMAHQWLRKAADQGLAKAQAAIGAFYFLGPKGFSQNDYTGIIEQNYNLAQKYLLASANSGMTESFGYLAYVYYSLEDYDQALLWAHKGASINNVDSFQVIANCYDNGLGVEKNEVEALKWYEKAADEGDAKSMNILGNIYSGGKVVPKNMNKSFEYYQKAATLGEMWGMYNLGMCYLEGEGTAENNDQGVSWLSKSAEAGCPDAFTVLGNIYRIGELAPKDEIKAIEYYQHAAGMGDPEAMWNLHCIYSEGGGTPLRDWLKAAADAGYPAALNGMGNRYRVGDGVQQDLQKANEYYENAAGQGNPDAMWNLACMYSNGEGVPEDHSISEDWLKKAADAGYQDAIDILNERKDIPNIDDMTWATFENIWVTQRDKSSVIIHAHFHVENAKDQQCHIRYTTKVQNKYDLFPVKVEYCQPEFEDTLWTDFQFVLNEKDYAWPTSNYILDMETTLTFIDEKGEECGSWSVSYKLGHKINTLAKNELTLL